MVMRRLPKYLLFASLGLLLMTVIQVIVAIVIGWSGNEDMSIDLLLNIWRYPLLAVVVAVVAIAMAGLMPKPRNQKRQA